MSKREKDASAVDLGKKRWARKSLAERKAHMRMMLVKRWSSKSKPTKEKD